MGDVILALAALSLHAVAMLAGALLLAALQAWASARLLGRAASPWAQPWRDLVRLSRKQPVTPERRSWLFEIVPVACLAALATAALLVPSFTLGMATAPLSDLIVLAGLLAAERYAVALAGYETGTALGGMGGSRITAAEAWAAPAMALVVLALAMLAGTSNLDAIIAVRLEGAPGSGLAMALAGLALALVGLAVRGTGPGGVLTSSQDAAVLDYSGRYLAMVIYAGHLRGIVWLSLAAALFLPAGLAPGGAGWLAWMSGIGAWAVKIGALGLGVVVLDHAAMRFQGPRALAAAALSALLAVVLLYAGQGWA